MFCFFYDQQAKRRLAVEVLDDEDQPSGELFEVVPLVPKAWHPAIAFVPIDGPMPIPRAFTDAIRSAALETPELEETLKFLEGEDYESIADDPDLDGDWSWGRHRSQSPFAENYCSGRDTIWPDQH